MKIVSACLVGINCNYKGENKLNEKLFEEFKKGELFPICPEVYGGQPTPRPNAEIKGGNGYGVHRGKAKVIEPNGKDVSVQFINGAYRVLDIAKALDVDEAILKARSPSCGCGTIYDGTFSGKLRKGDGVLTALLKRNGFKVYTDENYLNE